MSYPTYSDLELEIQELEQENKTLKEENKTLKEKLEKREKDYKEWIIVHCRNG